MFGDECLGARNLEMVATAIRPARRQVHGIGGRAVAMPARRAGERRTTRASQGFEVAEVILSLAPSAA